MNSFVPLAWPRDGYFINKSGQVISTLSGKPRLLSPSLDKDGYLKFTLRTTDSKTTAFQHRLLAISFIPNLESLPEVNHKDGNKSNNALSNLEWVTKSENMLHSINVLGNPKPPSSKGKVGELSKLSKPIVGYNASTGEIIKFCGSKDAQRVSEGYYTQGNISTCLKDKTKTHRGFTWYFEEVFNKLGEV